MDTALESSLSSSLSVSSRGCLATTGVLSPPNGSCGTEGGVCLLLVSENAAALVRGVSRMLSALAASDGGACKRGGVVRGTEPRLPWLSWLRGLPSSRVASTAVEDGVSVARRWRRGVVCGMGSVARCSSVGAWVATRSTNSRLMVGGKALRGERMAAVVSRVGKRLPVDLGDGLCAGAVRV